MTQWLIWLREFPNFLWQAHQNWNRSHDSGHQNLFPFLGLAAAIPRQSGLRDTRWEVNLRGRSVVLG
jgi:hypothetical protein